MRITMSQFANRASFDRAKAALLAEGRAALETLHNLRLGKETREAALGRIRHVEEATGAHLFGRYNGARA